MEDESKKVVPVERVWPTSRAESAGSNPRGVGGVRQECRSLLIQSRNESDGAFPVIVQTPRLRLRELAVDDAGFVLKLVNEPSFLANIGDKGVRTLDDAREFILKGPWTGQQEPGYGQFLVELKESGDPIGVCGLLFRESLDVTNVGFALLPGYWKRGFAYEAASAVMDYGRSELGIEKIVGLTSEDNPASIKVLKKLGMTFERVVKMSDEDPGTVLYA